MSQNKKPGCCCGGGGLYNCNICGIPTTDLTISWTSSFFGPGSITATYSAAGPTWTSECFQLAAGTGTVVFQFTIRCTTGIIEFDVGVYSSGTPGPRPPFPCVGVPAGSCTILSNGICTTSLTCGISFLWTMSCTGTPLTCCGSGTIVGGTFDSLTVSP